MDPRAINGCDPRYGSKPGRTKINKVQQTKFLGAAPKTTTVYKKCHLALPHNDVAESLIDEADLTTSKILAEIRSKYSVWVKVNRGDRFVILSGDDVKSLNLAKDALRVFLLGINQDVQNRMVILTHHSIAATQAAVQIRPISQDKALYRPTALMPIDGDLISFSDDENGAVNFQHGLDGVGPENTTDTGDLIGNLADQFRAAVEETGKRLRPAAGELRVRGHMGVFAVKKRQSKTDKYESDESLKKFLSMGADRGYIFVSHRLGNESWAARMLEIIYETEEPDNPAATQFLVADSTAISIRDMKPKFTLVLFAKDLKIEVDINCDLKYDGQPWVGSMRAFSFSRDKVAEVAVSCPNRAFDWHLSVEAELPKDQVPTEVSEFIQNGLKFRPPVSKKAGINNDFLVTQMNKYLLRAASIDNIACKVFWTFQAAKTPYYVEVSVYHEWGGGVFTEKSNPVYPWKTLNTAAVPHPIKSCGVSVYGHEWDHRMRGINKPGRGRQADFVNGFPELFTSEDYNSSIEHFLQEMQRLHDFSELANGGQDQI